MKKIKEIIINNRASVILWEDGKYSLFIDKKIKELKLPEYFGGPTFKTYFFDSFLNESKNEYYIEISLNGLGKFDIYKKGEYIGKHEPLSHRYHRYQFPVVIHDDKS